MRMDDSTFGAQVAQRWSGEAVRWMGQPEPARFVLRGAWWQIPASLLWAGFAFFWEGSVIAMNGPWFFKLWSIPFVLIGLYITVGRYVVAWYEATRTQYAVTDGRILIRTGAFQIRWIDLPLATLQHLELTEHRAGRGTIVFGQSSWQQTWAMIGLPMRSGREPVPAFVAIADAARAYQIITQAQTRALRPPTDSAGPPDARTVRLPRPATGSESAAAGHAAWVGGSSESQRYGRADRR